MTELDKLRKQEKKYQEEIDELENDNSQLHDKLEEAYERINELSIELTDWQNDQQLDTSTMINSMKYDKLLKIWDKITLEDLEAIGDTVNNG